MVKYLIKIGLTVVAIAVLIHLIGSQRFLSSIKSIDVPRFLLAFSLFPAVIAVGTLKWKLIVEHEAEGFGYWDALVSFLGGAAMGLLTPGRVGELGRVVFITAGRRSALTGIAIVDRMIDLEVTVALGIVGSHIFLGYPLTLAIVGAAVFGAYFIFYPQLSVNVLKKVFLRTRFSDQVNVVATSILMIEKTVLLRCVILRTVASAIDIFQFYLLCSSFVPVRFIEAAAVYPTLILSNLLPLTVGGVGIRESISMLALSKFGVSTAASASSSFLLFCINSFIPALIGILFLNRLHIRQKR